MEAKQIRGHSPLAVERLKLAAVNIIDAALEGGYSTKGKRADRYPVPTDNLDELVNAVWELVETSEA